MRRICLPFSLFCLLAFAVPAYADLTGFLGINPTPVNRPVKGFAIGAGLVIIGFEAEYADTSEDVEFGGPSLRTFMFNGLLQTPIPIAGFQFYGTLGGGVYRESLSTQPNAIETNFGSNIGGGAKMNLAGPLRLRLDYRVFNLHGTPRHTPVQRFYAGLNLKF
ncbi:MAG TPA: outer membrane beta-barrel protein [Vicinamibacterales bacterium]|jgi:opacity protein-like surface antigen